MSRLIPGLVAALLSALLAACAGAPVLDVQNGLLRDEFFAPATDRVNSTDVFALSTPMRTYLDDEIAPQLRRSGLQRGLIEALYKREQLKVEYDATRTRNAAEAFEARAGNCLSLVILTAALAKELGLNVHYQSAYTDETWARSGELVFRSGHVNITLGRRFMDTGSIKTATEYTVDFLPADAIRGLRTREISERTVVAMYLNNRAAEALAAGEVDNAYAWARAALRHDASFSSALNTLGVIYLQRALPALVGPAIASFEAVLQQEPLNTRAMFNLAAALDRDGRTTEAAALRSRLAQIEPEPPFHWFDQGRAAMQRGDYATARQLFAREIGRMPYQHEFHFWLAQASYQLGDVDAARRSLLLARDHSTNPRSRGLYAAKLAWVQAQPTP